MHATKAQPKETRDLRVEPAPAAVTALPGSDRRWALVVGVDQYQDKQITPLTGAAADAHALAEALVKYAGFEQDHVILLATDLPQERQPTKGNILVRLSNPLERACRRTGGLLFSFAGHGIERGGPGFSAFVRCQGEQRHPRGAGNRRRGQSCQTVDPRYGHRTGVDAPGRCRNDPMAGRSETPNPMAESVRKAFTFDVQNHDVEAFATLYATRVGGRAYLNSEKGHGYFTWALLEGLRGEAANAAGEVDAGRACSGMLVQDTRAAGWSMWSWARRWTSGHSRRWVDIAPRNWCWRGARRKAGRLRRPLRMPGPGNWSNGSASATAAISRHSLRSARSTPAAPWPWKPRAAWNN